MEEFFKNHTPSEVITYFINKWCIRGFVAWLITAMLCRFSPFEFAIALGITLAYVSWMIKAEWKQYKRWLQKQKRMRAWKSQ